MGRRIVVRLALLVTLFAMHGLPAATPMQAMPQAMTVAVHAPVAGMDMGCGMDHAGCVAVLRPEGDGTAVAVQISPISELWPSWLSVGLAPTSRGPPAPNLTGLCVSRT